MNSLIAITVVCAVFAVGDFVSAKTKSIFSMMFVASFTFLIGFWVGLPKTIFEDAGLTKIGVILIAFLITHMGTLMNFKELKTQWRTVLISLGAVAGIGVFLYFVGTPILGREYAVASAPPIAGGVVAALIMGEAATKAGFNNITVFVTLLVVVQGFFGYPVASVMLNREARRIRKLHRENASLGEPKLAQEVVATLTPEAIKTKKYMFPPLPKELQTTFILLSKLGLVALLGFKLSELTNGVIHQYVMCLIVGIIGREVGFLEENIMVKANAFGLAMLSLMAVVFASLTKATPEIVLSLLWPLFASLTLGLIGIVIASIILGKWLGYSKEMAISIGVSALFGFPGTFIISNEVANAVGENEDEKKAILNHIMPKMLIAGFMTVTISSVILAGFMAKLL